MMDWPLANDGLAIGSGGGRWWPLSGVGKEAEEGPGADNVNEGPSAGITAGGTGVSWRDGRGGALEECGDSRSVDGSRKREADNRLGFKQLPLLDGKQFVHCLLALTQTQLLYTSLLHCIDSRAEPYVSLGP